MSSLSPRQMFLLDQACKPICEGFGATPFLVGSAIKYRAARDYDGHEPRDVDVRLILDDEQYAALAGALEDGEHRGDRVGHAGIAFLGLAIGQYLASLTGLPIDFQIQQRTAANAIHGGGWRNPLGRRVLSDFSGDAPMAI